MEMGKFLVIDGSDGAGKATQTTLLVDRLRNEGRQVEKIDFPRYKENHFGRLLRECLDGAHGDFLTLDPKITSLIYAADRFESSKQIRHWLESGIDVVADRYVSANMLHQGAKIVDKDERKVFFDWLDVTEFEVFAIPRPDIIVYLDAPYSVRKKLLESDSSRSQLDTVEVNEAYQTAHEAAATHLNELLSYWYQISCVSNNQMRERSQIHEDVYRTMKKAFNW